MKTYVTIAMVCSCLLLTQVYAAQPHTNQPQFRDPTRPADYVGEEGANPWELNAVFISSERRVAVINGISVTVGDMINGEKVMSINPDSVTVGNGNDIITLYLVDKNVKKSVPN